MEENNTNKDKNGKRGFYVALYSTVALVALIAIGMASTGSNKPPSADAEIAIEEEIPVNQSPVKSYKETTTAEPTTAVQAKAEPETEPVTETKKEQAAVDDTVYVHGVEPEYTLFDDTQEMLWPVSGQIVMDYSMETGIFDKTLEQYRTHDSICISAGVGESVCAAADGVVLGITKSEEKGNTVVLDHGNGWCTTYSQIDNINLAEGQVIKQGDIIGCIAQPTKYSSALGSHLDFMVALDREPTDPKLVLMTDD